MNKVITLSRWLANQFRNEKLALCRFEKKGHFSVKCLLVDALFASLVTVGIFSLADSAQSSATSARLTNVGAIELTSPQLINPLRTENSDGHVYWLGAHSGFVYTVNSAVWGTHWIEYHQSAGVAAKNALAGVRICTFANEDFFAAHLQPLQASLLTGVTTPKGRHAAYDPEKMDEVVVHFPGERAVAEVYFSGAQSAQTLITAADALVSF